MYLCEKSSNLVTLSVALALDWSLVVLIAPAKKKGFLNFERVTRLDVSRVTR
jgi:hypothetical protein